MLLNDGVVKRGYLGVQIRELDPEVAERLGVPKDRRRRRRRGLRQDPGRQGRAARRATSSPSVTGKAVKDGKVLQSIVATLPLDKAIDVDVFGDGKASRHSVVVEPQPAEYGLNPVVPGLCNPRLELSALRRWACSVPRWRR